MPSIGRIQSTNFQVLLDSLGITRNNIPFDLRSEVTPVVLVGGTVSFIASPTPAYRVVDVFTAGVQIAPPINTVLADTGPLVAGAYTVQVIITVDEGARIDFQWRDVPNTASLWTQEVILGPVGEPRTMQMSFRLEIQNNSERFRVQNPVAGGVGQRYQASILART